MQAWGESADTMSNKFMGLHFHVDRARNYNRPARGAPAQLRLRREAPAWRASVPDALQCDHITVLTEYSRFVLQNYHLIVYCNIK